MDIQILDPNPKSEASRLVLQVANDLHKRGIMTLPHLGINERSCLWQSRDNSIKIFFVSTGENRGQFLVRQEEEGRTAYHVRSAEFIYA